MNLVTTILRSKKKILKSKTLTYSSDVGFSVLKKKKFTSHEDRDPLFINRMTEDQVKGLYRNKKILNLVF